MAVVGDPACEREVLLPSLRSTHQPPAPSHRSSVDVRCEAARINGLASPQRICVRKNAADRLSLHWRVGCAGNAPASPRTAILAKPSTTASSVGLR